MHADPLQSGPSRLNIAWNADLFRWESIPALLNTPQGSYRLLGDMLAHGNLFAFFYWNSAAQQFEMAMKITHKATQQPIREALGARSLFDTSKREPKVQIGLRSGVHPVARDQQRSAPVEIYIQPEFDFESRSYERGCPQTALVPVATLGDRRQAGLLDVVFIVLVSTGFIGLFHLLGGQISFEKVDVLVCAVIVYLFYAFYFLLFTVTAGATPGMQLMHLAAVRLDGSVADTRELLWRAFGYLVSGATLLGFFWAVWDEDQFTWQDRISQTYLTSAVPFVAPEPTQRPATRRALVRK